jgi:hypothetical protein
MSFFAELGLSTAFTMISLAPMVPEWLRGNPQPQTKINVMVGLPPLSPKQQAEKDHIYKQLSYGGCAPEISLFNANGDRVGHYRNWNCDKVIDQNSPTDLWADYLKKGNTEKAEYITVAAAGTDAICISAVAVTYPTSSDTYAFLPGEVAAVCNNYKSEFDYYWSESETTVQFRSESGKTQDGRPKCMWIDQADSDGNKATHYEGFQVHLPDFKLDNSTFKTWQDDPSNMCDSLARFGSYDRLNPIMCPEIFSPAPSYGKNLPLDTISACIPAAKDGTTDPDVCDDDRFNYQDRYNMVEMYDRSCPADYTWYDRCKFDGKCPSRRRSIFGAQSASSYSPPITSSSSSNRKKQGALATTEVGFPAPDHPLQKRFAGVLVKSRDITQSAVRVCESKGSIGPDFFSEHEQMFCDMTKRKLYPACTGGGEIGCFDLVNNETRVGELEKRGEQSAYLQVKEWT